MLGTSLEVISERAGGAMSMRSNFRQVLGHAKMFEIPSPSQALIVSTKTVLYHVLHIITHWDHIDGLVQDCGISSALTMNILQSCTTPWMCCYVTLYRQLNRKCQGYGLVIREYQSTMLKTKHFLRHENSLNQNKTFSLGRGGGGGGGGD